MDAIDLNSRRDDVDSLDSNVNGLVSPKAENVGVLTLLPCSSTWNCYILAPICIIERQPFQTSPVYFRAYFPLYVVPFDLTQMLIRILKSSSLFKRRRRTIFDEIG